MLAEYQTAKEVERRHSAGQFYLAGVHLVCNSVIVTEKKFPQKRPLSQEPGLRLISRLSEEGSVRERAETRQSSTPRLPQIL